MKSKKRLSMICLMLVISMIFPGVQTANASEVTAVEATESVVSESNEVKVDENFLESGLIKGDIIITPMFTNIGSFINAFDIINGIVYVNSTLTSYDCTHSIVYLYLEQQTTPGSWTTYDYWMNTVYATGTATNVINITSPSSLAVPRGTYRLRASGYVYNGSTFLEKANYTSGSITY